MAGDESRSLFRVKVWSLWAVFLACAALLRFASLPQSAQLTLVGVAMITSIGFYFVRCEKCKTPLISLRIGALSRSVGSTFIPPKHCPVCGKERI